MKFRMTIEVELGDLTDEQRKELEDDLNFVEREKIGTPGWPSDEEEEGYTPPVPLLAEQDKGEIRMTLRDALEGLSENQDELWAGTDVYARIVKLDVISMGEVIGEENTHDLQCQQGLHSWVGETGKLDPETTCKYCGEKYGHPD